jgi:hypothetical protein
MRHIKFRAWHRPTKKYLSADQLTNPLNVPVIPEGNAFSLDTKYVDYEQFTGLKDKNIFENDILQSQDKLRKYVVSWNEKQGRWYLKGIGKAWCVNSPVWSEYEIIGNVADNPELLNAK